MRSWMGGLGVMMLAAGQSQAATVLFGFTSNGPTVDLVELFDAPNNLTLRVTGGAYNAGGFPNAPFGPELPSGTVISQTTTGLGINNSALGPGTDGSNEIDGNGWFDVMTFTFSRDVTLRSVVFTAAQGNDNFDFAVDGVDVDTGGSGINDRLRSNPNAEFQGASDRRVTFPEELVMNPFAPGTSTGSVFQFYTNESNDDYRIAEIVVEAAPEVIPLPSTAWLLLAGLGAFLGLRRRRGA